MSGRQTILTTLGLGLAAALWAASPAGAEEPPQGHGHLAASRSSGDPVVTRAQGQGVAFDVAALNASGITGTARLAAVGGDKVEVAVALNGAGAGLRPIHVHEGACADLNPTPEIILATVANGTSTTVVDASLQRLTSAPHAIFVHKSPEEIPVFVACADLAVVNDVAAVPSTGDADFSVGVAASLVGVGGVLAAAGHLLRRRARRAPASMAGPVARSVDTPLLAESGPGGG